MEKESNSSRMLQNEGVFRFSFSGGMKIEGKDGGREVCIVQYNSRAMNCLKLFPDISFVFSVKFKALLRGFRRC